MTPAALVSAALWETFRIPLSELVSRNRRTSLVWPRQIGMAALMDQFGFSSTQAAAAFRRRQHGTSLHACRTVEALVSTYPDAAAEVRTFLHHLAKLRRRHLPLVQSPPPPPSRTLRG